MIILFTLKFSDVLSSFVLVDITQGAQYKEPSFIQRKHTITITHIVTTTFIRIKKENQMILFTLKQSDIFFIDLKLASYFLKHHFNLQFEAFLLLIKFATLLHLLLSFIHSSQSLQFTKLIATKLFFFIENCLM